MAAKNGRRCWLIPLLGLLLAACQAPAVEPQPVAAQALLTSAATASATLPPPLMAEGAVTRKPPAQATTVPAAPPATRPASAPLPTPTPTSTPTATATLPPAPSATPMATATPLLPCRQRVVADNDLLALVTLQYGLSRDYEPDDLVPLSDYLGPEITLGYNSQVRQPLVGPLLLMLATMHQAGLQPSIISAYRSYSAQAIAYAKWQNRVPDRAAILSAPPGHSEHQLGTTIDFGSPELAGLVGDDKVIFHTDFYKTSEGQWLAQNAYRYGFTLSYTRETFLLTGLYYEPWHYRYVGVELATRLHDAGITLIQYLLAETPAPCLPDE